MGRALDTMNHFIPVARITIEKNINQAINLMQICHS